MPLWASAAITILLASVVVQNLYIAFKPIKNDEERELEEVFSYGDGPLAVFGLFFAFAFWFSGKLFSDKYQLVSFRVITLLMAALMVGLIGVVWNLDAVANFIMNE
ncbi:hypothetical protein [Planococcus dechangensis]|uniref:Uncharacterized protein n=1 Tax=Planococcus dechangensis TaxID=1176255 RepID=A0ABV9MED7_9BACL